MNRLCLAIALACGLSVASAAHADAPIDAGTVTLPAFTGSGSDGTAPIATAGSAAGSASPTASVPDPAEHPAQAWDDAKAARKGGWPLLVFFVLVALTKALAYGRDKLKGAPLVGWIANRLAQGKTAMIVAGIGALAAAGYDVLANGGSVVSALTAAGVALAGALHSTTQNA
jgi:hypothetical protein